MSKPKLLKADKLIDLEKKMRKTTTVLIGYFNRQTYHVVLRVPKGYSVKGLMDAIAPDNLRMRSELTGSEVDIFAALKAPDSAFVEGELKGVLYSPRKGK